MEFNFELWYLFPVSIAISTTAMASGVGGAIFFSPLFMFVLGLEAQVAIGTALLTELFGFTSGVIAYLRSKLIDFSLGLDILKYSIPAAIMGALISPIVPAYILKIVFGIGILYIGIQILRAHYKATSLPSQTLETDSYVESTCLVDRWHREFRYTYCNRPIARFFGLLGGAFVGLISVGLGELIDYHLVSRCRIPTPVAVATAVFTVVLTVLIASTGHLYQFIFHAQEEVLPQITNVVLFTIPGVLIGGQLGPRLQKVLPEAHLRIGLSVLFMLIGFLMLGVHLVYRNG
ncbi:MAG: sulfite exporter TauE/SafE family protein [Arenibacter algicola]